jgi:hypothetical protein
MEEGICIPVKVAREHIENGIPGCPNNCMVALAIQDPTYISPHVEVSVTVDNKTDHGSVRLVGWRTYTGELPEHVVRSIKRFDRHEEVEPFEFDLVLEREEEE